MRSRLFSVVLIVALLGWVGGRAIAQSGAVTQSGSLSVLTAPNTKGAQVDYVHAKAMPLPRSYSSSDELQAMLSAASLGDPGSSAGSQGNGATSVVNLGIPAAPGSSDSDGQPREFGTSNHPFSTARADLSSPTNTQYPYRAAGKLFFNAGMETFVCSASLIKRGVVVTAAHCVAEWGQGRYYSNWHFVPGYRNGVAPFNTWSARRVYVGSAYLHGTDKCAFDGIVCPDDVAVILLNTIGGAYPGTATGWFGYGWNGYGFAGTQTQITQLGYPVCLDDGLRMERNDSRGFVSATNSNNTVIGSLMCGGSSGGPWVVNLGIRPTLTATGPGTASSSNKVVGVTSWGYETTDVKEQGASPFTSTNIVPLVNSACALAPAACS